MGKLIPLLFAGAGAAAVSVGGVYLLNSKNSTEDPEISKSLSDFKDKKGGTWTKRFFGNEPDFKASDITDISSSSGQLEATYFNASSGSGTPASDESQLIVNWERRDGTSADANQKWSGNFRWLWNFRRDNKGFSMFVATKPSSTANTLDLEGGLYLLERESADKDWKVKKKKELPASGTLKSVKDADFDKTLPKAHTDLLAGLNDVVENRKNYWGFVSGKDEMGKVCQGGNDGSSCPTSSGNEKIFRRLWAWKPSSDSGKKLADWSENFEQWSKHLFCNGTTNLKTALDSIKGTWSKA